MMMNFKKVAGAGIAAVTFSLMASSAMAATIAPGTANFATQAIPASGVVTINANQTPVVTTGTLTATAAGSFNITYTLPAGVTFATTPTLTVAAGTATVTGQSAALAGGGAGSQTVVFTVTTGNVTAAGTETLTLGSLQLTGATALSTQKTGAQFPITELVNAATGNAAAEGQTTPLSAALATSQSALQVTTAAPTNGFIFIDVTSPSNGTKFKQGATAAAAGTATPGVVADIGSITVSNISSATVASNSFGTGAYAFTGTTASETVTLNTSGLSSAYLSTGATCAATAAAQAGSSVAGTIGSNAITFPGVVLATGTAREVCLYSGTTLIGNNGLVNGVSQTAASATVDTSTTTANTVAGAAPLFVPTVTAPALASYAYNGTAQAFNYITNTASNYSQFIRIVNTTAATQVVTAVVTSDTGASGFATVETGLVAGNNDLVPVSTIATAAGVASANSRYAITLFSVSGVNSESLLLNPGGVVTQIQ